MKVKVRKIRKRVKDSLKKKKTETIAIPGTEDGKKDQ